MHSSLDCTFEACDGCRELESLEKEIRRLSEKRAALKNSRNASHDRLSTKLPTEIICKIFVLVDKANNRSSDRRPPVMSKVYFCAPVILSSVCRRWREIALSLPELWTNVYLNLRKQPDQITKDWLDRSKALPLNLTLYWEDDESGDECLLEVDPICHMLRTHSARWQSLDLQFAPGHISYSLFDKLQTMPQSDSFEISLGRIIIDSTGEPISLDSPFRPGRYHSTSTSSLRILPCEWNNLTHLELDYYEIEDILGLIRAVPKLKRCILRTMRHLSWNLKNSAPVEHKVLEDLDVTDNEGSSVYKFLQNITLPSLRHLKYDLNPIYPGYHHHLDFDHLNAFFVRSQLSSKSIWTFSLQYHDSLSLRPVNFLELAGVTHLSFDLCDHRFDSSILDSFLLEMSDLSILPRLQDLRFQLGHRPAILRNPRRYQAALSNFIAEHNFRLKLAKNRLEQGMSSDSTVDNVPLRHKNAQDLDLTTNDGTPPYRPLRLISIEVEKSDESDESEVMYIAQRNSESDAALQETWFLDQA